MWCEGGGSYDAFVLVDDFGNHLAGGRPTGGLPALEERRANAREFRGSRFERACAGPPAAGGAI